MKSISAKAAVRAYLGGKPHSVWASNEHDALNTYQLSADGNGAARVYRAQPSPKVDPKFSLSPDSAIFAAGSCFAREIEIALHNQGRRVLSWTPDTGLDNSLFHRYTTHSIISDFRFALENNYDPGNVVEYGEKWIDFTGHGSADTREEMLQQRATVIDVYRRVVEADVLFVTLGLVEAWFDHQTQLYTNIPPWGHFFGSRFELRVTDYTENRSALAAFVSFVREHVRPDLKIILTVSPVPLNDTFSGQDIVIANAYSKAVLRAVAQDVASEDPHTDYFPSYEMVTLADPATAWYPDYRHVRREFVQQITDIFQAAYMSASMSPADASAPQSEGRSGHA